MHRRRGVGLVLLALLVSGGCNEPIDELPREPVSGKVTFQGNPLEKGQIQFLPASGQGETQAGAPIEGGSYSIPRAEGPVPGRYTVVITASPESTAAPALPDAPGKAVPIPKELIPARYNTKSTLTAEIKKGETNSYNFELKK